MSKVDLDKIEECKRRKVIIRDGTAYLNWKEVRTMFEDLPVGEMRQWPDRGLEWTQVEGEWVVSAEGLEAFLRGGGGHGSKAELKWRLVTIPVVSPQGIDELLTHQFRNHRAAKQDRPAPMLTDGLAPRIDRLLAWVCEGGDPTGKVVDNVEAALPVSVGYDTRGGRIVYVRSLKGVVEGQ